MLFPIDAFPGTNLQDLNLDWLVDKVKELESRVEALEEIVNENEGG